MEAETQSCEISVDVVRVKEEPDWGLEEQETNEQVDWSIPQEFKKEPSWDSPSNIILEHVLKATCLNTYSGKADLHTVFQIKAEPGSDSVDSSYDVGLNTDRITDKPALYESVNSSKHFGTIKTEPTLENGDSNELASGCKVKDEPADWSVVSSNGYNADSGIKNEAVTDTVENPALNDPDMQPELQNDTQKQNPFLIQSVSCHICKQSFKNKRQLRRHSRSHAEKKETRYKPFYCLICKEEFSQLIKFTAHLETHTENPYTCEICKKYFESNSDLVKHSLSHSREKPHSCEFCAEKFTLKMELLRHKLTRGCLKLSCDSCENHAFLFNTRHKRINILRR